MIDFDRDRYYYDEQAAEKVIYFIEHYCRHIRGDKAGQLIELAEFWKEDIICPAFGIKRKSNGKRRFKTVYVEIGKGNAKSTIGSALALYLLGFDASKGAEVYSVAGDMDQARIIFDTARYMVQESDALQKVFETYQHSIVKKNTPNFYKVISAEAGTKHGLIPSAIIFDEVHVQPNRELWDTLTSGQMKRDESICFAFTTAGWDKNSICYELHKNAVAVNSGIMPDDAFMGVIYSAPETLDISSPKTWRIANPGLGVIISEENMQIEYNKVLASPSYENTFRRLHLNQWTDSYEAWISDPNWMQCAADYTAEDLEGLECYGGLDLAATRDFNAFSLIFSDNRTLHYYWLPSEMIDRRMERSNVNFRKWVDEGFIRLMPGSSTDHGIILNDIRDLCKRFDVISIAYDRKYAASIVTSLEDDVLMTPFDQSIGAISFPTKQLDIWVGQKQITHNGHPVLRWMLGNVSIYRDPNDNIKVVKHKSADKVDGVVALIMAIGEKLTYEMKRQNKSVYEERGVIDI